MNGVQQMRKNRESLAYPVNAKGINSYWLREVIRNRTNYYFLFPMFAFFTMFLIIPAIQGLYLSFFEFQISSEKHFVGLGNFVKLFVEPVFWIALKNTFYLVFGIVPLCLFLSLIISVVIIKSGELLKSFVRGAFYLPLVISGVTLALTWKFIFDPVVGLANYLLGLLGFERIIWLGDTKFSMLSIMIVIFTYNLGKPIIIYMAALGGIPESHYEAAKIDGAGRVKQFIHITLPMLKPTTLYLLITGTIGIFQTFVVIKLLTSGGPNNSTQTLAYLLYEKAFVFGQYGVACAVGTILFIIVTSIAILQYKFLSSDIEY
jgi:multiple sugar transport system permease protein